MNLIWGPRLADQEIKFFTFSSSKIWENSEKKATSASTATLFAATFVDAPFVDCLKTLVRCFTSGKFKTLHLVISKPRPFTWKQVHVTEYYELPIVYLSRSGCKDDGSAPGLGHTVLTGLQDPERALEYKICQ